MLVTQFIGLNAYFGVNLFAALVCFGVFWLIFDAWTARRARSGLIQWLGFLMLSLGFLVRATAIQSFSAGLFGCSDITANTLRLLGYLAIALGLILEPVMKRPEYDAGAGKPPADSKTAKTVLTAKAKTAKKTHHALLPFAASGLALPLAAVLSGGLYLRRATIGLERQLLPLSWAFAGLTVFELLGNLAGFGENDNPLLYQLVSPLGPVWWAALLVLAASSVVLGRWVWKYLTKRFQSELFISFVVQALGIFLFTTTGFTFFQLRASQAQSLTDLATAGSVLQYAIAGRQAETSDQAEMVAANSAVSAATAAHDTKAITAALTNYLPRHGLASLLVVDESGQVLHRGEDPERISDSRSSDPLVRRALIGEAAASVVVTRTSATPAVMQVAASPIHDAGGNVIGAVIAGRAVSNAFVDGIRKSTGLDSAVYSGSIRAATTLVGPGGNDRAIGITETSPDVLSRVLSSGKSFTGLVSFQNRPYLAAYAPLIDITNTPVGMLLVARPAASLYDSAYQSIQLIFLLVVVLVVLSIYPIFRFSRYLSRQI